MKTYKRVSIKKQPTPKRDLNLLDGRPLIGEFAITGFTEPAERQ